MIQSRRNSDNRPISTFLTDWANRIIPPLLVAAVIGISGGAWATYSAVAKITDKVAEHERILVEMKASNERQLALLQARIDQIDANSVKRMELLEILKRVEQQLEIALLRSGVKVPPKMLSGGQP